MAWFRGDDRSHSNAKLLAVGLAGTGLYWRAVSWCAGEESDGRVPVGVVASLAPTLSPKARSALVASLVREGLWEEMPDLSGAVTAYAIHDYLDYNPTHAELQAKREREKARVGRKRGPRLLTSTPQQPDGRLASC